MKVNLTKKKLIESELLPFGFRLIDGAYHHTVRLTAGQFDLNVTIHPDGTLETEVIDPASGDKYVLHLNDAATGSFVGQVREEYHAVLDAVIEACYEDDIFRFADTKRLIAYVRATYGDELEYLWQKFPDNAVWRRKDNRKWYAAVLTVSRRKLGFNSDEIVEIIDLRMRPEAIPAVIDHQQYFPGWHMNKKNWITIILDGSVAFDEICHRLEDSYQIAKER